MSKSKSKQKIELYLSDDDDDVKSDSGTTTTTTSKTKVKSLEKTKSFTKSKENQQQPASSLSSNSSLPTNVSTSSTTSTDGQPPLKKQKTLTSLDEFKPVAIGVGVYQGALTKDQIDQCKMTCFEFFWFYLFAIEIQEKKMAVFCWFKEKLFFWNLFLQFIFQI